MKWEGEERRKQTMACQETIMAQLHQLQMAHTLLVQRMDVTDRRREEMHQENREDFNRFRAFLDGNGHEGARAVLSRHDWIITALVWCNSVMFATVIGLVVKEIMNRSHS